MNLVNLGVSCEEIMPLIRFIKNGILPIIQIGIPIILIVFGSMDLGKAVMSSDEKEIKGATSKLIKRAIAAVVVFFIPFIVNLVIGLVGTAKFDDESKTDNETFKQCWQDA